jgi:hypothetical protein
MSALNFVKPGGPRLTRNAARCRACGTVVESKTHDDFRSCACGRIAVDGGLHTRKAYGDPALLEDLCAYEET